MAPSAKHSFLRGGIHVDDDGKQLTAAKPIERFVPREVTIPLIQHLGPAAKPIVQRKSVVKRGELIAEAETNGVPMHASVSGTVKRVALQPHPTLVECMAIVIETDPSQAEPIWEEVPQWNELSKEDMIEAIANAGIVGLGGASFPTYRKLRLPPEINIDTLIINGAECEPYLTSDHRLMLEDADTIISGALLLGKILGVKNIMIGIEDNKIDAGESLQKSINKLSDSIKPTLGWCNTRYPQGSEKQLIEALTGRVVPAGKLPMHVGVMVQNVATAQACNDAIRYRKPLLDRIVTVSGKGITQPKNLSVPIGTLIDDIIIHCGGIHPQMAKLISGGPMMGRALARFDVPVIKGTGGLLFLRRDEISTEHYGPCISCGRCLEACPLGLEPNQISLYVEAGRALETLPFGTKECFECGCCSFSCPAGRPLVQFIQMAKSAYQTGSAMGLAVRGDDND